MGEGVRCKQVELVLDELDATRHAITVSNPGDLIVICVDQHAAVMGVLESYGKQAQPGARREREGDLDNAVADPDFVPAGV
jgi:cyanophycin synthetase